MRSDWPAVVLIIAVLAAVVVCFVAGPAPEFAGWVR